MGQLSQLSTIRQLSWTMLSVLIGGAMLVLLAFYSVSLALLALLALLIVGLPYALTTMVAHRRQRAAAAATPNTARASMQPMPELTVLGSSGEALHGRLVPVEQADGCALVLTAQGYVLVNDEGRVVHRLVA